MEAKARIGFFVIGGLALFAIGLFLIGDRHHLFARHRDYVAEFGNLAGLTTGAKVKVAGMDAGEVLAIEVPASPSARFRVTWRIDARLDGLVRTDSVATIATEGVVGGTYLSVRAGTAQGREAAVLATIPSKEPQELSELLAGGTGLIRDAQGALAQVSTTVSNMNDVVVGLKEGRGTAGLLLRDEALASEVRQAVTTASVGVRGVVADLNGGRGTVGVLLHDQAMASQVRAVIGNAQQASNDVRHATEQADALLSDLKARQVSQKAGELMAYLSDTARKVHDITSEVAEPDREGMSAGANIRDSLTNANMATVNLAESTEALKHNFLTRGFFKKRGYYNLDDISPEKYRKDQAFTSRTNHRVWLSAAELFQNGSNGEEELSAGGKALLNAALAERRDVMVDAPIVVEGYSNGDAPTEQLRLSRQRALVVRQYLQTQFKVNARNLGIVPMKDLPPTGMGRSTWDGICVVVLRRA
jgi:phospholipid/cholesterol/gamma-HCH transport system substrate-binding protein